MSNFNDKALKGVAEAAAKIMGEALVGNQHKIDANKNGKVDAHDFKLLRGKKTMKEEEQIDEAFPTVADGEKSLRAKEGKTSMGTVSKTKTGLVHTRDYEDDSDEAPAKKGRPTGGGAGKSTKKKKLTEMIAAYKERGIDSLYEEPDNATFTKELEDQKAKFDGKKKGGDVAKPSVQAVKMEETDYEEDDGPLSEEQLDELSKGTLASYTRKAVRRMNSSSSVKPRHLTPGGNIKKGSEEKVKKLNRQINNRDKGINKAVSRLAKEEVEQIDEISKELAGKYLTAPQGKGANKYKVGADKSVYPNYDVMSKHDKSVSRALKRSGGSALNKKPSYYKEEEQLDEVSKKTLGSYIKAASHDVAAKGAFTRHFADKSRAETAAQRPDLARITMKKADKMQDAGMKRRANMAKAVDRLTKEDVELDERTLTPGETAKKEEIVKSMKKGLSGFRQRYGDRAKEVMYATATKQAKKD